MIVPRFTLRSGLLWLTGGAVVAIVLREANNGAPWAIGVVVGMGAIALAAALHAATFALSLLLSRSRSGERT